ncbi:MAG TPA: helix-turn-helix transcriptional regulator [Candidatus Saccharimonadales bacterium]|nr:helix-turn-helix transcriptional regulator [Candidatus Saccharimonadales bacterium]
MNDTNATPYRPLGRQLKELRNKAKESLAEASGAVEIDVRELARYELGQARPTEDVLLLLISHFGAKDEEAVRLWDMAGYGRDKTIVPRSLDADGVEHNQVSAQILFTDVVDIVVNNYGVVMNFMQSGQAASQSVARVGMSREHARSILKILERTLSQTERDQAGTVKSPDNETN